MTSADGEDAEDVEVTRLAVPYTRPSPVEIHRPRDADGSVVFALHGQGMTPRKFARVVRPAVPPRTTLVLPRAPLPFEVRRQTENGVRYREGASWYVYLGDTPEFLVEMQRAEAWLAAVHDAGPAKDPTLDPVRTALLGFSQGGYLAGYVGLRDPERWRRLVVCGARIKHEVLEDEARAVGGENPHFRVLAVHGADDASVPPGPARTSAERVAAWGVPAEFRTYPGGHEVLGDAACRAAVRAFLGEPYCAS